MQAVRSARDHPRADVDLRKLTQPDRVHGRHKKDMVVLHETVSGDIPGTADIVSPARFLNQEGYGIHLVVDAEGKSGWLGDAQAIVYHAASGQGGVNTRSVGIEQVSRVPLAPSRLRYHA